MESAGRTTWLRESGFRGFGGKIGEGLAIDSDRFLTRMQPLCVLMKYGPTAVIVP